MTMMASRKHSGPMAVPQQKLVDCQLINGLRIKDDGDGKRWHAAGSHASEILQSADTALCPERSIPLVIPGLTALREVKTG